MCQPGPVEPARLDPLVICRRSGVVWLDGRLAWHVVHDDAVLVVVGGTEQDVPLPGAGEVLLEARSKTRQADLVLRCTASVEQLAAGTPEWDAAVTALAAGRGDPPPVDHRTSWAATSRVLVLRPVATLPPPDDSERTVATTRRTTGGVVSREA